MNRTILCVPGHRLDLIEKSFSSNADMIMYDLEDSVPVEKKATALRNIKSIDYRMVRINRDSEEFLELDKENTMLVVPKINTWYDLNWISDVHKSDIGVIIETPMAVINLEDIMICYHDRIKMLFYGYMDFINLTPNGNAELLSDSARLKISMYANAYNIPFIDSPCLSMDENIVKLETERAIKSGCSGKGILTPSHAEAVNEMFEAVSDQDVLDIARNSEPVFVHNGKAIGPAVTKRLRNVN